MRLRDLQAAIGAFFAVLVVLLSAPACAQTYTVAIATSNLALGNVASGASGDTEFDLSSATGAVTKLSGSGARLSTTSVRATVTVTCTGNTSQCNNADVNVRIGTTGSPTNRARALNEFAVTMGTAVLVQSPTGTNPLSFRIDQIPRNTGRTFYVGADFPIAGDDSGLSTGTATSGFYVWVAPAPSTPTGTYADTENFTATVYRSLSMSKTSDLNFGRLVKPTTGSGTVSVSNSTGARTVPAAAGIGLSTPTPTRAAFTVTGETGKVVAFSLPTSVTMSNGSGGTLAVTLNDSAPTSTTLSTGSYTFGMGGSFTLSSTTPSGAYSGTFNATVNYN